MAKNGTGILSPFKDCAVPIPSAGDSAETSFGKPLLPDAPPPTQGIMKEVQFATIDGGDTGRVDFYEPKGSKR